MCVQAGKVEMLDYHNICQRSETLSAATSAVKGCINQWLKLEVEMDSVCFNKQGYATG